MHAYRHYTYIHACTVLGGLVRDAVPGEAGYIALFLITCLYFGLSGVFVLQIRNVK